MTLRAVLKQIREDLATDNVSYLNGPRSYSCDKGEMLVYNQPAADGGQLLGMFEARLTNSRGETVKTYKL
jgi:hypothetical protein